MQIVIDIPEELYANIQRRSTEIQIDGDTLENAVLNGTPLPKRHGRLIDADAYIDKHEECGWLDDITIDEFNAITPTIIDTDKTMPENVSLQVYPVGSVYTGKQSPAELFGGTWEQLGKSDMVFIRRS